MSATQLAGIAIGLTWSNKKQERVDMAFKTRITELLDVGHPIVQGGMQRAGTAGLACAGSLGGDFGILTTLTQPAGCKLLQTGDLSKGGFRADLVGDAQAIIRQRLQTRRGVA
jgi:NAD(P)H-dependent flavin oxidoreductase YrpB (nitropropane dioxygenase family)